MAAITAPLLAGDVVHQLAKRRHKHNWAYREPGVVLVFCIVFLVALGIIALFIYKLIQKRRERRTVTY